jgi:protoheme IX farnesyltransferase
VRGRAADLAALAKLRIAALSTLSAVAGFLAFSRGVRAPLTTTLAGTLLLAAGAAALNEVIDAARDARMERTRDRPIPSGRISVPQAVALAGLAATAGAALLWRGAGPRPALLGLTALLWYDAVYTPLKRVTPFAVIPGAVVGALPPAIGWAAAGGALTDARLHALCAFFLLWQVPHAWLLALRHAGDFERGGFPTPASHLTPAQLGRVTWSWTLATALTALLAPLFGLTRSAWAPWALLAAAAAALPSAWRLMREPGDPGRLGAAFGAVNRLALALMGVVLVDAVLPPWR